MSLRAEVEQLQRSREEKLHQIQEKRRQVEELKKRRAAGDGPPPSQDGGVIAAKMAEAARKDKIIEEEMGRSIDSLILHILNPPAKEETSKTKKAGRRGAAGEEGGDPESRKAKGEKSSKKESKEKASAEAPLTELRDHTKDIVPEACAEDRALQFTQDLAAVSVTIDSKRTEHYDRCVQTDTSSIGTQAQVDSPGHAVAPNIVGRRSSISKDVVRRLSLVVGEEDMRLAAAAAAAQTADAAAAEPKKATRGSSKESAKARQMTHEERERIEGQEDFRAFFEKASLMVERTLGMSAWSDFDDNFTGEEGGMGDVMRHADDFIEERYASGRTITDVGTSPHYREMMLASYAQRENPALSDPEGCMLVWNMSMRNRPELVFTCSSSVLTAQCHQYEAPLFYGGTHSGGVVLWDARAGQAPVMRSLVSGRGHAYPVQAMQQVGNKNAANLITASNDGRLCVWSLAMLSQPQDTVDLRHEVVGKGDSKLRRDTAVMSLAFPAGETNTLYVGNEDGCMCQVQIFGANRGVTDVYDAHEGPVTGIDIHPCSGKENSSLVPDGAYNVALSCSFDWSVKLWKVRQDKVAVLSLDSFEDYVYDVKWHPQHPAAFASVDGEGYVGLWNLNRSLEAPVTRLESPSGRKLALSHCDWFKDGRRLVTGDSEGMLSVYAVDQSISQPDGDELVQFQDRLRSFNPPAADSRSTHGKH